VATVEECSVVITYILTGIVVPLIDMHWELKRFVKIILRWWLKNWTEFEF
jgi:hypothetical protein